MTQHGEYLLRSAPVVWKTSVKVYIQITNMYHISIFRYILLDIYFWSAKVKPYVYPYTSTGGSSIPPNTRHDDRDTKRKRTRSSSSRAAYLFLLVAPSFFLLRTFVKVYTPTIMIGVERLLYFIFQKKLHRCKCAFYLNHFIQYSQSVGKKIIITQHWEYLPVVCKTYVKVNIKEIKSTFWYTSELQRSKYVLSVTIWGSSDTTAVLQVHMKGASPAWHMRGTCVAHAWHMPGIPLQYTLPSRKEQFGWRTCVKRTQTMLCMLLKDYRISYFTRTLSADSILG